MTNFLLCLHRSLWGIPVLVLVLAAGLYIGLRTRFVQLRLFPRAVKELIYKLRSGSEPGAISPFQALCTALAATVGTGNLVGVAGAICLGGPGAVFWMWVCGILGMGLKFAEVTLALDLPGGEGIGGPMYMIQKGMGRKWMPMAYAYAAFGLIAAFGVGNATQVGAVISSLRSLLEGSGRVLSPRQELGLGIALAVPVGAVLLGGAGRIASAAERIIPFAAGAYILLCLWVLFTHMRAVPEALRQIVIGATDPQAVTGGVVGTALQALRVGCARGVFTNEAGMGTASMAHACAKVRHPAEQGLLGIVEVFLDTIVICTLTALVILVSGVPIPYGVDAGGTLTGTAFSAVCGGWVHYFLTGALCCFAFATVLGWGLYGVRCGQFLFKRDIWGVFALCQTATVVLAPLIRNETLWLFAEVVNGAMAIPNLIALVALTPRLRRLTIEYERNPGLQKPEEVPYADFDQRQPLRALSHAEIPSPCRGRQEGRQEDLPPEHRSARPSHS